MSKTCKYCGKECREESLPRIAGSSRRDVDYVCDNPKCEHFGEVVVY